MCKEFVLVYLCLKMIYVLSYYIFTFLKLHKQFIFQNMNRGVS